MSAVFLTLSILLNSGVIKEDFLVNPDLPYTCGKGGASATALKDGWYVTWQDGRNAAGRSDIFGQALTSSLVPLGANTMVPYDPAHYGDTVLTASDSAGNAIVLWKKTSGDAVNYWLRRVSPTGELLREDTLLFNLPRILKVLDVHATVAMNAKGEYAIAWPEKYTVNLAVFNADGSMKSGIDTVIFDSTCIQPQVAIADNGAVIVAWSGDWTMNSPARNKVFARCYRPSGQPRGDVFEVASFENNPDYPPTAGNVAVGCDHAGLFIVTWILQDGFSSIKYALYYRRFGWDGTSNEPAERIYDIPANEAVEGSFILGPRIAVGWDASFSVAWSDQRSGPYRTYLMNFYADGTPRGSEMILSEQRPEDCEIQSLARHDDQWFAVYTVKGTGTNGIRGRRGNVYGSLMGSEVLVNDDVCSASETMSQVMADDSGNSVVLWNGYGRRFSKTGTPLGDAFTIADSSGTNPFTFYGGVYGSMNPRNGEFVLACGQTSPARQFKIQRYSKEGVKQGTEIEIGTFRLYGARSSVSMNRKGSFAVVWTDTLGSRVRVRRYDKNNQPIDANPVEIGTEGSAKAYVALRPAVFLKDDGGFIVAWGDARGGIWTQVYKSSAAPIGGEVQVTDVDINQLALASDASGNFCVAWENDTSSRIRFYDAQGSPRADARNTGFAPADVSETLQGISVAALPGEGFVFYATDTDPLTGNKNVSTIYYHSDGTPWSDKQVINQPDAFSYSFQVANFNSAAAAGDRMVYAWQDNRRHLGWDIYAKVMDLDIQGVDETSGTPSPITLSTSLNRVSYCVAMDGEALLDIFSVDGRRVERLVVSGSGTWDPGLLPSGVYFARLVQGTLAVTGKVLVVK